MPARFLRYLILVSMTTATNAAGPNLELDLRNAQDLSVRTLVQFDRLPDEHGVLQSYSVALPAFEQAVYYVGGWWPAGGNRVYPVVLRDFAHLREGGLFLLAKLSHDDYLAVLPLCGPQAYAWFDQLDGQLRLKLGTHGAGRVTGDLPLCAWARAANPYEACYQVWHAALNTAPLNARAACRQEKEYPEALRYLGWCSWEHFKGRIDEANLLQAMTDIEASGLPVRYMLIDDGHFDSQSLDPNARKFPNGYQRLTARRRQDGIRWLGIWYAFLGSSHGTVAPGKFGDLSRHLFTCKAGKLLPHPTEQAARAFYDYVLRYARRDGLDFLKVDFQTDALPFYAGTPHSNPLKGLPPNTSDAVDNPLAAAANLAHVFQQVVAEQMHGLINCNWHNAVSLFNSGPSVVGRCSEDYSAGKLNSAKRHLHHSYAAIPWLGQIAWGDHDMFHSSDPFAGRMMAVSKALSGGPVYLSDEPTHFVPEVIRPLANAEGKLYRPLAPAAPLPADLFYEPDQGHLFRVVAPLSNGVAAFAVYNLDGGVGEGEATLTTTLTAADYGEASAMIQPYPGRWKLPPEGLLVYDWYAGKAQPLADGYRVDLRGFSDRLLQFCPIRHGWAVLGRTDKYLSAAAVEVKTVTPNALSLALTDPDPGPLTLWTADGTPSTPGLNFEALGDGLYRVILPASDAPLALDVRR